MEVRRIDLMGELCQEIDWLEMVCPALEVMVRVQPLDKLYKAISRHSTCANAPVSNRQTAEWSNIFNLAIKAFGVNSIETGRL